MALPKVFRGDFYAFMADLGRSVWSRMGSYGHRFTACRSIKVAIVFLVWDSALMLLHSAHRSCAGRQTVSWIIFQPPSEPCSSTAVRGPRFRSPRVQSHRTDDDRHSDLRGVRSFWSVLPCMALLSCS